MVFGWVQRYFSSNGYRDLKYFDTLLSFSDDNIEVELNRNGIAHRLCYIIPSQAFSDWFSIVDPATNEDLDVNPQIQTILEDRGYSEYLNKTVEYILGYGGAGTMQFDNTALTVPADKHLGLEFDENRQYKTVSLLELMKYPINGQVRKYWELTPEQIPFFQFWQFETKVGTFERRSLLEAIWDYLQVVDICMKISPVIVASVTGMKTVTGKGLSADNPEDKAFAEAVRTSDKDLVLFLREGETLDIKYPPQNTFIEQTLQWAISMIAATLGLPKEFILGNQVGTTSGASQTITEVDEYHRMVQRKATRFIKQDIKILANMNDITLPDQFTIYWNKKAELTEMDQTILINGQVSAVQALISIGYTLEDAKSKVGI